MKDFKASKVVFKLPEKLEPNTSYWVRSGEGFDLYLSDVTGSVAYKPNVTSSQLADTLPIGKGGTGATDAATARGNLGLGTAATRNVKWLPNRTDKMFCSELIACMYGLPDYSNYGVKKLYNYVKEFKQ